MSSVMTTFLGKYNPNQKHNAFDNCTREITMLCDVWNNIRQLCSYSFTKDDLNIEFLLKLQIGVS